MPALFDPELPPGAHLVRGWLSLDEQRHLVDLCRQWARGPVPMHAPMIREHQMSVRTVCLGWHWQPYRYSRTADDVNGERVLDFPEYLVELGRRAVADTSGDPGVADRYTPDAALVNFYDTHATMGMHQDRDERSPLPVVSLSLGDTCTFRLGNTSTRNRPWHDIDLDSGDLIVFGGPSRYAYHGVPRIHPGTAPTGCGLASGRLNITLRVTGLGDRTPAP